jgi:hypothetical protein
VASHPTSILERIKRDEHGTDGLRELAERRRHELEFGALLGEDVVPRETSGGDAVPFGEFVKL